MDALVSPRAPFDHVQDKEGLFCVLCGGRGGAVWLCAKNQKADDDDDDDDNNNNNNEGVNSVDKDKYNIDDDGDNIIGGGCHAITHLTCASRRCKDLPADRLIPSHIHCGGCGGRWRLSEAVAASFPLKEGRLSLVDMALFGEEDGEEGDAEEDSWDDTEDGGSVSEASAY